MSDATKYKLSIDINAGYAIRVWRTQVRVLSYIPLRWVPALLGGGGELA